MRTVLTENLGDGVRLVSLNRPHRLNAIVPEMVEQLVEAVEEADREDAVRAIVLTGTGRAFCSGADLKELASDTADEAAAAAYIDRLQDVTRAIVLGDTPVVGAIRGWTVGGGLEWVINCDFAIAAEGTRFFFPEMSWGLFVTGGVTELLPRLVGLQRAREMILLGEKFDARQAQSWGLLKDVVADAELMPTAITLAKRIAALPVGSVRDLRRILTRRDGLEVALAAEAASCVRGTLDPRTSARIGKFAGRTG
jgi:enoyl-CoA hydratase/carnithine racemase